MSLHYFTAWHLWLAYTVVKLCKHPLELSYVKGPK